MTKKKKKKESWKEKRRRAAAKHQKTLEAERLRREREPKKSKGWSRNKLLGAVFFASVVLVVGVYAAWQNTQPAPNNRQLAPLFTLADLDGNTIALENLTGKVVVLDFFATSCGPCVSQMPHLAEINRTYDSSKVEIVSIGHSSDSKADLQQFGDVHEIDWIIASDTDGVFDKYNVGPIPTLVVIDQNGYIHYRHEGVTYASTLSAKIDALLSS